MDKLLITKVTNGFLIKIDGDTYVFNSFKELVEKIREEFGVKEAPNDQES